MRAGKLPPRHERILLPILVFGVALGIWAFVHSLGLFPESTFPGPVSVARGLGEELGSGRLLTDMVASIYRVAVGFGLAVALGIPVGLWLGYWTRARVAFLPAVNFFRNLSPLAWIPFAVLWFGVGDAGPIFLIFLSSFFPIVLALIAAVASIPSVYFRVAREYGLRGTELLSRVVLPAVMPELITSLRVAAGISWTVLVAAEMLAGRDGLGFAIHDARNGLRTDLVVVGMIAIGLIGIAIDRALRLCTRLPSVRWGYER